LRKIIANSIRRRNLHRVRHIAQSRDARELGGAGLVIGLDIVRHVPLGQLGGFENRRQLLGFRRQLDHIAGLEPHRWDGDPLAIDLDMAVAHELAGGMNGRDEFGAIDDGVDPPLEKPDQMLRSIARHARGFRIEIAELALGNIGVIAFKLLLGAELDAEIGKLALAPLAMLARAIFAFIDRTLGAAPDVLAHAAVNFMFRGSALRHRETPSKLGWSSPSSAPCGTDRTFNRA
jgi:hypothetical protein